MIVKTLTFNKQIIISKTLEVTLEAFRTPKEISLPLFPPANIFSNKETIEPSGEPKNKEMAIKR